MGLTKIDPKDYKLYLDLRDDDLKLFKWLLTKSLKASDSLLWLDVEDDGSVYGRVKHKGGNTPLQAWACLSASNQGSSDCPLFVSLPVQEVRQAIKEAEAGHKDDANRLLITLDGSGLIWVNRKRVGGNKLSMQDVADGLFVAVVEHSWDLPHGRPTGNPLAAVVDYQMILKYAAPHAAGVSDPVRYEMAFVWLTRGRAMALDNLKICSYQRPAVAADCDLVPIRSDVFKAESKAKSAFYFANDDGISSSICFTTGCDHGFSWDTPDSLEPMIEKGLNIIEAHRCLPWAVTISVKPVVLALREQIKAAREVEEIPYVEIDPVNGLSLITGDTRAPVGPLMVVDDGFLSGPVYIFSAHLFALLSSLSTEYCDLRFGPKTGKLPGNGLYASEGLHLEMAFMPCTTFASTKNQKESK